MIYLFVAPRLRGDKSNIIVRRNTTSWFTFIASDVALEECCIGIYQESDTKIIIPDEDRILNIYKAQYEGYPQEYTKLPYIMGVEIEKYEYMGEKLAAYIQEAV